MSKRRGIWFAVILTVLLSIACSFRGIVEAPLPTQGVQALQPDLSTFTPSPSFTPLFQASVTPSPAATATLTPTATETQSVSLKILLYEDTAFIGPWVKEIMDEMSLPYTYVSGSGALLEELQSDTKWSLIVIAAENKASIQGVIWELLNKKVTFENASLIAETWSIHLIADGKIKPFLAACGVAWQKNLANAVPVYVLDPQHPIFNEPNAGISLEKTTPHWDGEAVDLLKLVPNGYAKILAGNDPNDTTAGGLITSCFQGRVILQTFLNHDYPKPAIKALWQNYLTYMLQRYR